MTISGFPGAAPKPTKRDKSKPKPIKRGKPPARVRQTKAGKAKHAADRKWAEGVKAKGSCAALGMFLGASYGTHIGCGGGPIDAAHILRRGYLATRHDVRNGLPLCRDIHEYYTKRPLAFERFCRELIGDALYDELRAKALGGDLLREIKQLEGRA